MPVIVVANPKGGVGKSTLATQIAGFFATNSHAAHGHAVLLGDVDRQQSARIWLGLRPPQAAPITFWEAAPNDDLRDLAKPPKGATHVVLDTPAGLHGRRFDEVMRLADKIVVPLSPSIFDIHAMHDFIAALRTHKRGGRVAVGIVGMRAREGTLSADQLRAFLGTLELGTLDVQVLGFLRDTQNYVQLAAHGLTLWDVAPHRVERDLQQWRPIVEWLDT